MLESHDMSVETCLRYTRHIHGGDVVSYGHDTCSVAPTQCPRHSLTLNVRTHITVCTADCTRVFAYPGTNDIVSIHKSQLRHI